MAHRPHAEHSSQRAFWCPDELWERAKEKAAGEGVSVASVIRDRLTDYVEEKP